MRFFRSVNFLFIFFIRFFALSFFAFQALANAKIETNKNSQELSLEQILELAKSRDLHNDLQFLRLVHYQDQLFGGKESQVRNVEFYFDRSEGIKNPQKELMAMITQLDSLARSNEFPKEEENPFCRFPARVKWLRHKLPELESSWNFPRCERFTNYLETLRGESVSLVFSSYFLNNPSSAFGHTLLRINKKAASDGKRYELLDYGINFAANQDTNNPVLYAIKGLFGGFKGTFTSVPYYYKVREYNNAESRDLWEYELNFNSQEVEMLISHLWELGPSTIYYYYLSENCSYFVMTVLDAVRPELGLTDRLNKFVIPSDTIHLAHSIPGLVKRFTYRPSIHTELQARLQEMSPSEKAETLKIIKDRKINISNLEKESQRKILDAAIDTMDYRYSREVQYADSPEAQFKNQILLARSKIETTTPTIKLTPHPLQYPHASHPSMRWKIGPSFSNQGGNYLGIGFRFALHDQLDPVAGYPEYAQITFGEFDFEYSQKKESLHLENFSLFEVISNTKWESFDPHLSWRIRVGAERLRNENWNYCEAAIAAFGGGISTDLGIENLTAYAGIRGTGFYLYSCESRSFLGAGPELHLRYRWTPSLISLVEAHWRYDLDQTIKNYREISFGTQYSFSRKQGLRLTARERSLEQNIGVEWVYYH